MSQSRGLVITLNNFDGPIEVLNCSFNNNMVFFPSAAFSNVPKFNSTVLGDAFGLSHFLNEEYGKIPRDAYIEMSREDKALLNHTV